MTAQEALAARRLEWKDWFVQAMAFGYAQTDALRRAAAAKGMGLDLAQFSRPFPGSPMTQTITDNSVNAAPPPAAVPATGPSAQAGTLSGPAPGPAPERLPHGPAAKPSNPLAIMALTAATLLGGTALGAGVVGLLRPTQQSPQIIQQPAPPPAPTPQPEPQPCPPLNDRDWQIKIVP
jgi:hypothetical protein